MQKEHTISFNFTGGIISPGPLLQLLEIATAHQCGGVRFGQRQQLMLNIPAARETSFLAACEAIDLHPAQSPNIVSSYAAAGIFVNNSWLTESVYKEIFDLFDYQPACKINICDHQQTFVPLFTGHLNWISTAHPHFWQLYIRRAGSAELIPWPVLIYSNYIALISAQLELFIYSDIPWESIYEQVQERVVYSSKPGEAMPELPKFHLPYYEGFNRDLDGYWLGIYRRDEYFPVDFLKDVCTLCQQTLTGAIHATPWKSLLIRNISGRHRLLWDFILGKYAINVRHAANELNWQVEDDCEDGLILKRHIIRYFDSMDIRTYGLCFSVRIEQPESLFGSVVIRRQAPKAGSKLKYMQRYDILHTAGFNANASRLVLYRGSVSKEHLGPYVAGLCKTFYEQQSSADMLGDYIHSQRPVVVATATKTVYQCCDCLTTYDEQYGDPDHDIAAGTPFAQLPEDYRCSVCDADLSSFRPEMLTA